MRRLYADIELEWSGQPGIVRVRNRRAFGLRDLTLSYDGKVVFQADLRPGAEEAFELSLKPEPHPEFTVAYVTHRGLDHRYSLTLTVPEHLDTLHVVNPLSRVSPRRGGYDVELFEDDRLEFYLPRSWSKYRLDGRVLDVRPGLQTFALDDPSIASSPRVEWASSEGEWRVLDDDMTQGGLVRVRAKLPAVKSRRHYALVLAGTGAEYVEFLRPQGPLHVPTHSYRENRIPLQHVEDAIDNGWLRYWIHRTSTLYIHARYNPRREPIRVAMEAPRIEKIHRVRFEPVVDELEINTKDAGSKAARAVGTSGLASTASAL